MAGSTFGKVFRVTTWGESHGTAVGAVVDGCPPGLALSADGYPARPRPATARHAAPASTPRKEPDRVRDHVRHLRGQDHRHPDLPGDLQQGRPQQVLRPPEGDLPARPRRHHLSEKIRHPRPSRRRPGLGPGDRRPGGGRGGGQKTSGHRRDHGSGRHRCPGRDRHRRAATGRPAATIPSAARTPRRPRAWRNWSARVRKEGDTLGGIVEIVATGVPAGLGEPVFDKLDGELARALMSIGAVKGVEIGAGFAAAGMRGSENNDAITPDGFSRQQRRRHPGRDLQRPGDRRPGGGETDPLHRPRTGDRQPGRGTGEDQGGRSPRHRRHPPDQSRSARRWSP